MKELTCRLCGREAPGTSYMEGHHLVPRSEHGKEKVPFCVDCGNQVHLLFTNNELRDKYNTVEALLADERIQRYVRWVRRRKEFGICAKEKKRRR